MPRRGGTADTTRALAACAAALCAIACSGTKDSVGHNGPGGITLKTLSRPATYVNPFRDWILRGETEIATRVETAFNQLFHGDAATQAIFIPVAPDKAYIFDFYHQDVRTEGIGWGMIVAVQLNKRDEFDRLWRYSKDQIRLTGSSDGYFLSSCDTESGKEPCTDPFGMEQFQMALIFAHDRWGSTGSIDYGADAIALLDVMRHKEKQNGAAADDVTNVFDADTHLPFDFPDAGSAGRTRPSIVMPAYYELWAQATGDPFWSRAAQSGRELLRQAAHPMTGLLPVRSTFEGKPVSGSGSGSFQPEAYRAQINFTLDEIWSPGRSSWNREEANRVLSFFTGKGFDSYGTSYLLNGDILNPAREPALIATNGITAAASSAADRNNYVQAVWDQDTPVGPARYYQGIVHMLALLVLSGNYRVW